MNLKEFSEVAHCLHYILIESQIGQMECLCVEGATWIVSRPELASRKILSIFTNGAGDVIVEVEKAED